MMIFGGGGDLIKAISWSTESIKACISTCTCQRYLYVFQLLKVLSQVNDKRLKETSDDTLRKGMEILQNLEGAGILSLYH